jgi:hypothetical protein
VWLSRTIATFPLKKNEENKIIRLFGAFGISDAV